MALIPLYLNFSTGEVEPVVNDDGSTSDVVAGLMPLNYVVMNTDNTNPATYLGYGTWTSLGSATVGVTTIYYYKRTG
jgi:hypothetical protein